MGELKQTVPLRGRSHHRPVQYLNNIVGQDHIGVCTKPHMPEVKYDGTLPEVVRLVLPTDGDFDAELKQIPQMASFTGFQQIKPYSVIVRSVSVEPIASVSIRYDILELSGRQYHWIFLRESLSSFGAGYFPKDKSYLVTPSTQLNFPAWYGRPVSHESIVSQDLNEMMANFARVKTLTISVDSVVLANGRFLGRDRSRAFHQFTDWFRAEKDLIREMGNGDTWTDEELARALSNKEERQGTTADSRDHYGRRQKELAQRLLRKLQSEGRSSFKQDLEFLKTQKRFALQR